jgi:hypothetical protein
MALSFRFLLLALLTSCTLILTDCSKASEPVAPLSKTEMLTTPNWRITAATYRTTTNGVTRTNDDYANTTDCHRDNYLKFNKDKTLLLVEGPITCPQTVPQNYTYAWTFNPDESSLLYGPDASYYTTYELRELTSTTLHLRQTVVAQNFEAVSDVTYTAF